MRAYFSPPAVVLRLRRLGVAGLLLLAGCPTLQQPEVPATPPDSNPPPAPPDTQDPRPPIPPPPDAAGDDSGGSGGSGSGGGSPDTSSYLVLYQPAADRFVRLDNDIIIDFYTTGPFPATAELLLAHDDNADRQPDGPPVYTRPIAVQYGGNQAEFHTSAAEPLLANGLGRFVLGVRIVPAGGAPPLSGYASGRLLVDALAPTAAWVSPGEDNVLTGHPTWAVQLTTADNAPHQVSVQLEDVATGQRLGFASTACPAGPGLRTLSAALVVPCATYTYYVTVSDGVDPPLTFHAPLAGGTGPVRLMLTDRLAGDIDLNTLADSDAGAILQGFNFNDLAGSAMVSVPDLDGDGAAELLIGARFGKPHLEYFQGNGWGEAYLIYGDRSQRLRGVQALNSAGTSLTGVAFRGIRVPQNTSITEGLADITVVPDMDGDNLPELVFSFPRVESIVLGAPPFVGGVPYQHPDLKPDIVGMGALEYDAIDYATGGWTPDMAQFTRGGIVVVSSHNALLTDRTMVTRKFDRVLDLHEVGQMFSWMTRASVERYEMNRVWLGLECRDCIPQEPPGCACDPDPGETPCTEGCDDCGDDPLNPAETLVEKWAVWWDVWFGGG